MNTTPTNTHKLRQALCETVAAVRAGKITPDAAQAVANASGKIIASLRVELEYRRQRNEVPEMPFIANRD